MPLDNKTNWMKLDNGNLLIIIINHRKLPLFEYELAKLGKGFMRYEKRVFIDKSNLSQLSSFSIFLPLSHT